MIWTGPAEFFAMGGYGFYVWGSFVVTAICMLAEPIALRRRRRRALQQIDAGLEQHENPA